MEAAKIFAEPKFRKGANASMVAKKKLQSIKISNNAKKIALAHADSAAAAVSIFIVRKV